MRYESTVWPCSENDADAALDPPLQVEIQRQDGWLGGQVSAALATPLGDRFAHADLAAELARGVHHIGHGQARNLCDAHAAVVTQHEHKNVAFRVA